MSEGALIELVEGGDNFLFNVASSELKPGAIKILEELAPLLANLRNKIEIHGHTDARPFERGSKKTNWELSFERGDQARRVLEGKGIAKGKIQSVLAHADTALYKPNDPYSPENRRLSLLVVRGSAERSRGGLGSSAPDESEAPPAEPKQPEQTKPAHDKSDPPAAEPKHPEETRPARMKRPRRER